LDICTRSFPASQGQLTHARLIPRTEIPPAAVTGPATRSRPFHFGDSGASKRTQKSHFGSIPKWVVPGTTALENVLLQPAARVERDEERYECVHQPRDLAGLAAHDLHDHVGDHAEAD